MTTIHPFDMTGKRVLITGSTRGMGLAMAMGFHACGADVLISSNDAVDIDRALGELLAEGVEANGILCDLWDAESSASLAARVWAEFGPVDTLISHAGGWATDGPLVNTSGTDFHRMLLTGPVNTLELVKPFLPAMADRGGGSIVFTTSMASVEANAQLGGYGAAKAAINSIMRNIAAEWGPQNIRANSIAPGIVRTAFSRDIWRDGEEKVTAKIPLGRIAEPDEVTGAALLLGSNAGSYISGVTLLVDGGRHIV